ncbi:MAG: hypothetical protein HYU36_14550 [Planctomycetes bacterium]|nr:hypothetical protein [Planctomycetota bacterium]
MTLHYPDLPPGKHLVIDSATVADTYRLERRQHRPARDPAEPVMAAELPWEGDNVTVLHVRFDAQAGRYRMWYQAHDFQLERERKKLGRSPYGNVGEPQPIYLCHAESDDGVHWRRSKLDLYSHPSGENGICFKGVSGVASNTFMERPGAPPGERFTLVNCEWRSLGIGGIYIAHSPDGLRWTYTTERPVIHGHSDCRNSLVFNPERRVTMLYMRGWHAAAVGWPNGKGNPRRRVSYSESPDMLHWSERQTLLTPDELDTNDFYGMVVFRYGDLFIGQLWIYDDDVEKTIHIQLAFSRDGIHWTRLPHRPAFLACREPGGRGGFMVMPAQEPVVVAGQIFIYWTEHDTPHDKPSGGAKTFRGRLRLDGFVSLAADAPMGHLVTRPFTLQNDQITINAATHGGQIAAELVEPCWHDPEGQPVEGFAAKDCNVFQGDSTAHRLSWRGLSNLRSLRGRRLLLRMALVHAEIFSFTL